MSSEEVFTTIPTNFIITNIQPKQHSPELIDEVKQGLEALIILIAVCDIVPYLLLTVLLFLTFPLLSPVGIIRILFLINQSLKTLQKLE
jgi:hypothetical protein